MNAAAIRGQLDVMDTLLTSGIPDHLSAPIYLGDTKYINLADNVINSRFLDVEKRITTIRYLIRRGMMIDYTSTELAASLGYAKLLNVLIVNNVQVLQFAIEAAAANNHFKCVRVLAQISPRPTIRPVTITNAVLCGNLEMVQYLCQLESSGLLLVTPDIHTICAAIDIGRIDIISYLLSLDSIHRKGALISHAPNKKVAEFLVSRGIRPTVHALRYALQANNKPLVKYLLSIDAPINVNTIHGIINGHFELYREIIDYFSSEIIIPYDIISTVIISKCQTKIAVIKYFLQLGATIDKWSAIYAASRGDIEIIKFLISYERIIVPSTITTAVKIGHLGIVKLLTKFINIGDNTIHYAIIYKHYDILIHLIANGGFTTIADMNTAVNNNDAVAVKILLAACTQLPLDIIIYTVNHGYINIIKVYIEELVLIPKSLTKIAIKHGYSDIAALLQNYC